jgi:hypothetical protein
LVQAGYERLARLTTAVNRLTGYEAIDKLKGSVGAANQQLQQVKGALAAAKAEYDECLARQTQLHRCAGAMNCSLQLQQWFLISHIVLLR